MSFFDRQHQLYKASTRVFDVKTNKFYTKAFYGATSKEADDKLANFKKSYKDNKLTFGNIAQAYLLDRLGRIKEETVSNYQGRLEKHFIEIWDYSFARIDYKLIQNLLNKEKENGKSNNQLNDMISLFSQVSKFAKKTYDLDNNTYTKLERYKTVKVKKSALPQAEFEKRIKLVEDKEVALILKLAFYSGCRIGEILALYKEDIKSTQRISITKSITDTGKISEIPKTQASVREVMLPNSIFEELLDFAFVNEKKELATDVPLFKYTRHNMNYYSKKYFGYNTHHLRHSYASLMSENSVPIEVISNTLGHSSVSVTLRYLNNTLKNNDNHLLSFFDKIDKK
jgi:hypothetical protein